MKSSELITILISIAVLIVSFIFFLGTLLSYEIPHLSILLISFMWIQVSLFEIVYVCYKKKIDYLEGNIKHIEEYLKNISR